MKKTLAAILVAGALVAAGCSSGSSDPVDAAIVPTPDAHDPVEFDAAPIDAAQADAEADADTTPDADVDAEPTPAPDAEVDAEPTAPDAEPADAHVATPDAPPPDAPLPPDADTSALTPVVFTGANATAQYGNPAGGMAFNDVCPAGQALIGFSGLLTSATGYHQQITPQCGAVNRVGAPGSYALHVTGGVTLPTHGPATGTPVPWARFCPTDSVVSGFGSRSGGLVDQLVFSCTPLSVDAALGTTITLGTVTVLAPVGGNGGHANPQANCPAGQVATAPNLRSGDGVDYFGIICSTPSLP
jgi:hypothetical protein